MLNKNSIHKKSNSQAGQENFVLNLLNYPYPSSQISRFFIEFGALSPTSFSNTFLLDTEFKWSGLSFDVYNLSKQWEAERTNTFIVGDALAHDYKDLFSKHSVPGVVDYLQIDIDPPEGNLKLLKKLEKEVFQNFKFRVVTYEHDFKGSVARIPDVEESREIFKKAGYHIAFQNIHNLGPDDVFEDWYVYPDLVDKARLKTLQDLNNNKYEKNPYPFIGTSLGGSSLTYI